MKASTIWATVGTAATLGAGGLAAAAISAGGGAPPPTKTVTVNVSPGATGATGAQGPTGAAGVVECLSGYSPGILVLNAPGGQTRIYTCIEGP